MKLFLTVLLPILLIFAFASKDTEQKALTQSENPGLRAMLGGGGDALATATGHELLLMLLQGGSKSEGLTRYRLSRS